MDYSTIPPFFCSDCIHFCWRVKRRKDGGEVSRVAYCKRRDKPCAEVLVKKLRYQCIVTEKPVHKVDFYERGWFDYCDSWMPEQTEDPKPAVKQETKEERIARMVADFKKGV